MVPSFENAMPCGVVSCPETSKGGETKVAVETSKAVDSSYWFMSSPVAPTTNILVPSFENVTPCGPVSCDEMSKGGGTKTAVETSNVPSMGFPDASCTAPGSMVSSGVVSPATAVRCGAVRVNEIVVPSAAVPSSAAVRVMPPV